MENQNFSTHSSHNMARGEPEMGKTAELLLENAK